MSSHMRYDPVHDMDNAVPEPRSDTVKSDPVAPQPQAQQVSQPVPAPAQQISHKVAISSLLSGPDDGPSMSVKPDPGFNAPPVAVAAPPQPQPQAAAAAPLSKSVTEPTEPVVSKRVLLANKRKAKELLHQSNTPSSSASSSQVASQTQTSEPQAEPPSSQSPTGVKIKREFIGVSTSYNRSRHLKKPDSEPLLRADIQHDFLKLLLTNDSKFLTNPFDQIDEDIKYWSKLSNDSGNESSVGYSDKLTFFQLYLITILKSNRISKILKDRLVDDLNYAFKFIILCLLVNFGRLNTTINFDYEMRSQLRTYHCIPVLQTNHEIFGIAQEPDDVVENNGGGSGYTANSVKQLQDTPRLKTILKSVSDFNHDLPNHDVKEFLKTCRETSGSSEKDELQGRFNLISLIFNISNYEEQLMETFFQGRRFEKRSTVLNETFNLNSAKPDLKVRRFLWLIYVLHETDASKEQVLQNPFGEIVDGVNVAPLLELDDEGEVYNVDTEKELEFAQEMKRKRKNFLDIVGNLMDEKDVKQEQEANSDPKSSTTVKLKLNKKGRKRRIIDDNAGDNDNEELRRRLMSSSRSKRAAKPKPKARSKAAAARAKSTAKAKPGRVRKPATNTNTTNTAGNKRQLASKRSSRTKPKALSKIEILQEKLANKFVCEYMNLKITKNGITNSNQEDQLKWTLFNTLQNLSDPKVNGNQTAKDMINSIF